jgi:cyclase
VPIPQGKDEPGSRGSRVPQPPIPPRGLKARSGSAAGHFPPRCVEESGFLSRETFPDLWSRAPSTWTVAVFEDALMPKGTYSEREVASGVWQISGSHDWGSGVNAAVLTGDHCAVVVDSLYRPRDARRMFESIERRGIQPVALVNTHWHTDHTIGNSLFRCPIWSQKLGPRYLKRYWPAWVGGPRDPRAGGLHLKVPDRLFAARASLDLDGEEVQLIHVPGHTPDSVGVFVPDRRVFIAGDTVMELPFVWFGNSRQLIDSLRRIRRLRPRVIVQGHGPPCSSDRLERDIRYLERIRSGARSSRRSGMARKEFLERPLEDYFPSSPARTLGKGWREAHQANLLRVWNEAGSVR